jgi:oligosaccharide reducing-end xylanase
MPKSHLRLPLLLTLAALVTPLADAGRSAPAAAPNAAPQTAPPAPVLDDGKGAFATGKYRNLFAEIGHSPDEIRAKVDKAYNQLFHGDLQTQALFIPAGKNVNGPLAYIPDVQHTDVRSEGMSYGMMIAVQLNKKEEFDALWNWSRTYMYHDDPKHPSYGYFSWQMNYDGTPISEGAAPDGEEYFAMALLFAANRWPGGKGVYDYQAQAHRILHDMVHRETITGPTTSAGQKIRSPRIPADPYEMGTIIVKMPEVSTAPATAPASGPATNADGVPGRGRRGGFGGGFGGPRNATTGKEVSDEYKMILFVPDSGRGAFTDPSYHLPAFYELWARWGPQEDRNFWLQAAQASRDLFVKAANPQTGLLPNMSNFDGTARSEFQEDAWRCAMNWTVDWSWFAKDPRQQELTDRLQKFLESQGMDTYGDHFTLDGRVTRNRHSPGLIATTGWASLAATDKDRARKFAEALWNLKVPDSLVFRYYDGLLYMMCMLHASGQFQVIVPQKP